MGLWLKRVGSSVLGVTSQIVFSKYVSFSGEAWLLFTLTFLQPIFAIVQTVPKEWVFHCRSVRRHPIKKSRILREVLQGVEYFNSAVVTTLADLAHMSSLSFWEVTIVRRHVSTNLDEKGGSLNRSRQKEWILSENRYERFLGEIALDEPPLSKVTPIEGYDQTDRAALVIPVIPVISSEPPN